MKNADGNEEATFDLEKTSIISELLSVPRAERDQEWREDFFENILDASLASEETPVFRGPDGFAYFKLRVPKAGEEFEPYTLNQITEFCTDRGLGVAVFAESSDTQPEWIFTYGSLWSLRQLGEFGLAAPHPAPKPPPAETGNDGTPNREVIVSPPNEEVFPAYAQNAIADFFSKQLGFNDPRSIAVLDKAVSERPNLAFNIFPEMFQEPQHFQLVMNRLTWYLPPQQQLLSIDSKSLKSEQYVPLKRRQ